MEYVYVLVSGHDDTEQVHSIHRTREGAEAQRLSPAWSDPPRIEEWELED
jgi:hypothetical protein